MFYPILYDLPHSGYRHANSMAIICHFLCDFLKYSNTTDKCETKRPDDSHEAPLQIMDTSPPTAMELQQTTTRLKDKFFI